jgi:S1-C subfamily serine protease
VINRVFLISATETGTAFTIEVDGRQYLVTAKHIVKGLREDDKIQIRKNDQWSPLPVKIFRCDDPADIAVLVPHSQLSVDFPLEPTIAGIFFGGETLFVGFPYGLTTDLKISGGYPMGMVKKATLSGLTPLVPNKGSLIILDGYNNPGFSGSPVVFRDYSKSEVTYKVAGVVVSFMQEAAPILKTDEVSQQQITVDDLQAKRIIEYHGKRFRIKEETTDFVRLNTGIAFAHDIRFAVDLIRQHAIGPRVTDEFEPK